MASYRDLLADPAQRRLLLGSAPADFADWLDYIALIAVIIYVWALGAFELALLAVCFTLPYVTAGPFLAAWVDRTSLKQVLVVTNAVRAAATLAMAIAPNIAVLLVLVLHPLAGRLRVQPRAPGSAAGDHARAAAGDRQRAASGPRTNRQDRRSGDRRRR